MNATEEESLWKRYERNRMAAIAALEGRDWQHEVDHLMLSLQERDKTIELLQEKVVELERDPAAPLREQVARVSRQLSELREAAQALVNYDNNQGVTGHFHLLSELRDAVESSQP